MPTFTLSPLADSLPTTQRALTAVVMNGSEANRTAVVEFGSKRPTHARIDWQLTQSSASDVILTCSVSNDGGTTWNPVISRAISDGTGTDSDFTDGKAVSGDDEASLEYGITGANSFRVVAESTGADGSDTLDLQITLS